MGGQAHAMPALPVRSPITGWLLAAESQITPSIMLVQDGAAGLARAAASSGL